MLLRQRSKKEAEREREMYIGKKRKRYIEKGKREI
jgi:hypothetical protein